MIGLSPLSAGHRRRFQPTCVRPSTGSYPRFSLPTDSSPGFASAARDSSRPVKARFRSGSLSVNLAPRQRLAGSFYKRHAVTTESCSDCSWARGFRRCFTPLSGCFSPFPHGTGSLSVSREYLALPDGPGRFTQNSSCSALLRILLCFDNIRIRNCHALWSFFPESSSLMSSCNGVVLQPHPCRNMDGLGCSPFARHYWGNHCLFSFPAGTKMFQFPALASNNVG